jgi:two-component system NtrC family response regulator
MKEELCAKEIILSQTIIQQVCSSGEPIFIPDTQSDRKFKDTESILTQGVRSILAVPLKDKKQQLLGILYLDSRFPLDNFSLAEQSFIMSFATLVSIAIENDLLRKKEKEAIRELARLEAERKYSYQIKKLETEKTELKRFLQEHIQTEIIGTSPAMEAVFSVIRKVAQSDLTILIEGETGTGKELIARAVHQKSLRQGKPFVVINCAAIPENLLESELFGYEKGAFTDAKNSKAGKFELAHQGTIFLDEITELPLSLQVKLLRVLQEQEIERLGSLKPRPVDIRVIAASNKDVAQEVKNGRFRDDLFWRLNVVQIKLPPLRARGDDILLLANYFLEKFTREYQKEIRGFSRQCQKVMLQYPWPGNIRELENKIRRAVVMAKGEYITEEDLGVIIEPSPKPAKSLREARAELEREMIQSALAKHAGNQTQAAQELGLNRRTFIDLMRKYGLR